MAIKVEAFGELTIGGEFRDQFSPVNDFKKIMEAQNWETLT